MATYFFKKEFVPAIIDGSKTQTIRNTRKYPPKPGKELVLKTADKVFGKAVITEVFPIRYFAGEKPMIMIDGKILAHDEASRFAARDGISLETLQKFMRKYCRRKNRWNDFLAIRWKDFKPEDN